MRLGTHDLGAGWYVTMTFKDGSEEMRFHDYKSRCEITLTAKSIERLRRLFASAETT